MTSSPGTTESGGTDVPWLRFVALSLPRSGSNYLKTMLDQHPNVISNGELLNPKGECWEITARMDASCAELLRVAYRDFPNKHQKADIRAVGFKLLDWHTGRSGGRIDFFELLAADGRIRALHLTRENLLEGLRSHEQALQTGRWVADRPEDLVEAPVVHLPPELCLDFFQRAERFTAKVRAHFAEDRVLPLTYERLVSDPAGEFGRIHDFLGVPVREEFEPACIFKQEPRPLAVTVANFAELRSEFRGTPYECFFD